MQGQAVTEGLLNMVEMAFRAYDPCFGCATHSLPGPDAAGSDHPRPGGRSDRAFVAVREVERNSFRSRSWGFRLWPWVLVLGTKT